MYEHLINEKILIEVWLQNVILIKNIIKYNLNITFYIKCTFTNFIKN